MKLDVRLLIPGLPFDPKDPFGKSLGGSETAGIQMAHALGKLGHTVCAFASVEQPWTEDRVTFLPAQGFEATQSSVPSDLCIVQRAPVALSRRLESKVNFLWVHDLMFARRQPELMAAMHNIDRIVTVSRFQRDQWREVVPALPEESFLIGRNGIDLALIDKARVDPPGRERKLIVCGARPERGIDVLLTQVYPRILKNHPDARLALAAYDCPNPAVQPLYDDLQRIASQFGDRIEWHGALNKHDLYRLYQRAGMYLYPTPSPGDAVFRETSCISAMEAMACGCPVVASRRGGLIETVESYGVLIDFESEHAATEEAVTKFVAAASSLLDGEGWHDIQSTALEHARTLDWAPVAEQIVDEAQRILRDQSGDPVRLARHFIRRQDPEAAKATFAAVRDTSIFPPQPAEKLAELDEVEAWLTERYAHTETFDKLADHYASSIGPNNGHVFEGLMQAPDSRFGAQCFSRFELIDTAIRRLMNLPLEPAMLAEAYNGKPPRPLSILDFGCSQGECPISLHNRLGARMLGIDASPDEIERARKLAQAKAKRPNLVDFEIGTEADFTAVDDYVDRHGRFDVLVMAEVIEHLINPIATIERLEKQVRAGGVVVLTIPYGPWETQRPEPLRGQHLREWSVSDIREVLRGKESLILDSAPSQLCPVSGDVLGNLFISYKADGKPLGSIDWSRKLSTQRPRQTLSACMMLGGPHDHQTLHWCLESIRPIVDEIVVADTGMTDESKRIAAQYGVTIIPDCPSPLQVGFDVSRNLALDRCRSDWVIMIDGDEKLLTPLALWPYLRENMYWSYAVRQHHFAVDATWKPDMPGRIFRRRPDGQGRVIRHYGKLHEHPEFGVNKGAGNATLLPNVHLAHVGYLETQTRANRFVRNLPLLRFDLETNPDRELTQLVVCRDSMINARFNLGKAGINADEPGSALRIPECTQLARDVVGIWDKYFADNAGPMGNESMEFYHDACRMLGADVVADGLSVQRQGIGQPVGPAAKWFWSVQHYQRWLATRTKAATDPLTGAGY